MLCYFTCITFTFYEIFECKVLVEVSELTWFAGDVVGGRCCERCSLSFEWPLHMLEGDVWRWDTLWPVPLEEAELVQLRQVQLFECQP